MAKTKRYKCKQLELPAVLIIAIAIAYSSKGGQYDYLVGWVTLVMVVLFIGTLVYPLLKKRKRERLYIKSNIRYIDQMKGTEFEEYLQTHFKRQGYKVTLTPATNDYGADLLLYKNGEKIVVQVKRHKSKIGNKAIQEVAGALKHYKADRGMVITNSFFTANAKNLANSNGIELWDRKRLISAFRIKSL